MAGATSLKSFADNISSCPCLCLGSMSSSSSSIRGNVVVGRTRQLKKLRMLHFTTSLSSPLHNSQFNTAKICSRKRKKPQQRQTVVANLGGEYEDSFNDVKYELINYFTFKAVRTVLVQLYEMNPPAYKWFNNFVADNIPAKGRNQGTRFLQILVKERRELAERVMITRLSLYGRWIKKCNHGDIYEEISEENLKLMRERLLETIVWPSDDNKDPDKITE